MKPEQFHERFLDLRDLERADFNRMIVHQEQRYTLLVTSYQTQWLDQDVAESNPFVVVLPDIHRYERMLASGKYKEFLRLGGSWLEAARAATFAGFKRRSKPVSAIHQEF